jgi:hypothetical protein
MSKPKTVPNKLLIGFSDDQLDDLDKWRRTQEDLPTRSEGVRRLVDGGLARIGSPEVWRGFLRLSLVTCPVTLLAATADCFDAAPKRSQTIVETPLRSGTIEIDEFVPRGEIDPRYLIRPYYLRPDGKVGHDAFAVIRETIRETKKVAIGRIVLANREHIIALDAIDKGLMGTLLRHAHEVRSEQECFGDIQDVKITRDMLDLAKHIVEQKSGHFDPEKYHREQITSAGDNVINLADRLNKMLAKDERDERFAARK